MKKLPYTYVYVSKNMKNTQCERTFTKFIRLKAKVKTLTRQDDDKNKTEEGSTRIWIASSTREHGFEDSKDTENDWQEEFLGGGECYQRKHTLRLGAHWAHRKPTVITEHKTEPHENQRISETLIQCSTTTNYAYKSKCFYSAI